MRTWVERRTSLATREVWEETPGRLSRLRLRESAGEGCRAWPRTGANMADCGRERSGEVARSVLRSTGMPWNKKKSLGDLCH